MDPQQIQRLTEQAFEALHDGNDVRAVAIADQLAAEVPDDPVVRVIRAQALLSGDAPDEALDEARRAVELDPNSQHAHRLLGLAAWRAERLGLAQQSLERAVELSGRRGDVMAEYAWFMAQERGPRPAEEAARQAIEIDDNCSTAWAALGLALYRLRRRDEAHASLQRALALDPNDLYAQSAMAVLLQDECRDDQAEAIADRLEDKPGAEEFVEQIRSEAKRRQIARILVERNLDRSSPSADTAGRRLGLWLAIVAAMLALLFLLLWYFQRIFE